MTTSHGDSVAPRPASILRLLFIAIGVASLVLGYVGLDTYTASAAHRSFGRSPSDLIYYDLELFLLQSTPIAQGGPLTLPLAIARFSAPSVALYAVTDFVVAISARRVRLVWLRRSRGHAVVFGRTRSAAVVVERLRASGMRVLAVNPDAGTGDRWTVVGDPVSPRTLADAAVRHASVVYACCDESEANSEIAGAVEALRSGRRKPERVYALIDDLDLCTALKARRWSMAGASSSHVDFFNRDELAAQTVVRRDRSALVGQAPEMAVDGTGAFARSVIVELARQWAGRAERQAGAVTVVLVGADAAAVAARLPEHYPFLHGACTIQPWSGSLAELLQHRGRIGAPRLRRLYLCQEDEREAFTDALLCGSYLNGIDGVVVRLERMSRMAGMFHSAHRPGTLFDALAGRLCLVDITELGCDPDRIGDDLPEGLARAIHQRYLAERLAAGRAWRETAAMARWEDLPADLRRSNREQAADAGRKLASIRCLLTPLRSSLEPFAFKDHEIEMLAEAEHDRWTAERIRSGWRHGRDHDEVARIHPSLVPWKELPEDQREKDRQAIRALPGLLTGVGLGVVRVPGDEGALRMVAAS